MNTIYIFGIGSPFRDDAIGWQAIDAMQGKLNSNPHIVWEKLGSPGNIFTHHFDESDFIIFIDAVITDNKPGTINIFTANQLPASVANISSHNLSLKTAVDLLVGLGFLQERIKILGIEIAPSSASYSTETMTRSDHDLTKPTQQSKLLLKSLQKKVNKLIGNLSQGNITTSTKTLQSNQQQ